MSAELTVRGIADGYLVAVGFVAFALFAFMLAEAYTRGHDHGRVGLVDDGAQWLTGYLSIIFAVLVAVWQTIDIAVRA